MFSKENWYQSYWFEFFRLNCVHLYMQSNSIEYLFTFFFFLKWLKFLEVALTKLKVEPFGGKII